MLTNSEKAWLADRKKDRLFVCRFCPGKEYGREMTDTGVPCVCHCMSPHIRPECYKLHKGTGWQDAALFEARVAAKLAERCVLLEKVIQKALGAAEYINLSAAAENALKAARLQVEEEMDAN